MTAIPSKSILDGSSAPTTAQFKSAMGQLHDFLSERTDVDATASGLTVSTNNRVLGRSTAGAGAIEELPVGTGANNLVRLDASARLPAVDASLLINLPQQSVKQLQSVSASVASNALTVGLNPTTLDFRHPTLSNGSTNTRTVGSAISLVIPSGATLGTVSAVQSCLVLLAIDNAGVVELAITNLSGGLNLDETSLISTTAISAAAGSANVVYSTSARTNVPFRVVGYVESTQATAGTWASAPSTVQGSGGNALTTMQSLGFGQSWQAVTRTSGVTYYNTTGKPIVFILQLASGAGVSTTTLVVNGGTGVPVGYLSGGGLGGIGFGVIPAGASYSLTDSGMASRNTFELR